MVDNPTFPFFYPGHRFAVFQDNSAQSSDGEMLAVAGFAVFCADRRGGRPAGMHFGPL